MIRRLFHLVADGAWDASEGPWAPPSLAREGFVHLSFAQQLEGTLRVHFAAAARVTLLEVEPGRLGEALVIEPSRDGQPFPHLYRALGRDEVLARWDLERVAGRFVLPHLADAEDAGSSVGEGPEGP